MTINSLQKLFFIAVTFLLILCSSGLKKFLFSLHRVKKHIYMYIYTPLVFYKAYTRCIFSLAVWKACLPWNAFKKAIMLRAVYNLWT